MRTIDGAKLKTLVIEKSLDGFNPPLSEAARLLREGGTVIFPTETIYGLGAIPENKSAVEAVFAAKGRSERKPLALHISDASVVERYSPDYDLEIFKKLSQKFWPGPLSIILRASENVPKWVNGGLDTVSFRCPSHSTCLELLELSGGVVAGTSANISGGFSAAKAAEALSDLDGRVDCIVKDDVGILGLESTVISLVGGIKILRQGAIGKKMIEVVLGREVESAQVSRALGASQNDAGAISHRQRSKVRLYQKSEATTVFEQVSKNRDVAAVFFRDDLFFNLAPLLEDRDIKARIRLLSEDGFTRKLYSVLRKLDGPEINRIYLPLGRYDATNRFLESLFPEGGAEN